MPEIERLRELILEMGQVIRMLDDDADYLELWTQDGGYVLDERFRLSASDAEISAAAGRAIARAINRDI